MFNNADAALRWAFRVRDAAPVKLSGINRMRQQPQEGRSNPLIEDLTPLEKSMQAHAILGMVYEIDDRACIEYLDAYYSREPEAHKMSTLTFRVLGMLGTGEHNQRTVRQLMLCYMGQRGISHKKIREDAGCSSNKIVAARKRVYDALDSIGAMAMGKVEDILKGKEVVR